MFIGLSKDFPKGRIERRTFMNEPCLVFRSESGKLNMVEPYCSHFGVDMASGRVVKECVRCPMHGRLFRGDGSGANPSHRPIRSYPVAEHRGIAHAYFDHEGVEPRWDPPEFLSDEEPDVLWRHARELSVHHPSVPLDNSVDPRHFEFTHSMFGKCIEEGMFEPDAHRGIGTMSTQLTPPLSWASGGRASVVTRFDGPLNTHLTSDIGDRSSVLCNFLTIVEGRRCVLTQIGIGRRSVNPLRLFENAVGFAASWYATREDAAVWNDRKPQEPDDHPHQTDATLALFREWFDGFAYSPSEPAEEPVALDAG